ncbi:hypothetical protein MC885_019553, partial [Smutsia gigantea]
QYSAIQQSVVRNTEVAYYKQFPSALDHHFLEIVFLTLLQWIRGLCAHELQRNPNVTLGEELCFYLAILSIQPPVLMQTQVGSLWLIPPGNGTPLGSGIGMDLTCPFGVSSACGAQASWSIFGADAAEVPGTRGHSHQEAAMPHIPEDEEPPGEPQAAQSPASQEYVAVHPPLS